MAVGFVATLLLRDRTGIPLGPEAEAQQAEIPIYGASRVQEVGNVAAIAPIHVTSEERVSGLAVRAGGLLREMGDAQLNTRAYTREHCADDPRSRAGRGPAEFSCPSRATSQSACTPRRGHGVCEVSAGSARSGSSRA